jgi:hypothetical protein
MFIGLNFNTKKDKEILENLVVTTIEGLFNLMALITCLS